MPYGCGDHAAIDLEGDGVTFETTILSRYLGVITEHVDAVHQAGLNGRSAYDYAHAIHVGLHRVTHNRGVVPRLYLDQAVETGWERRHSLHGAHRCEQKHRRQEQSQNQSCPIHRFLLM